MIQKDILLNRLLDKTIVYSIKDVSDRNHREEDTKENTMTRCFLDNGDQHLTDEHVIQREHRSQIDLHGKIKTFLDYEAIEKQNQSNFKINIITISIVFQTTLQIRK